MTTPTTQPATRAERSTDVTPTVRQRPRRSLIGLGVALVAVFGLAGWWLATQGATPQTVVVAVKPLTAGQPITADQLGTTQITGGTEAKTIDSIQLGGIPGQYPIGDVPAGTIISPDTLVSKITPEEGQSIAAVGVKPSQMPAIGLSSGDKVTVVVTYGQAGDGGDGSGQGSEAPKSAIAPGTTWAATVVSVGSPADDQTRTVDLALSDKAAAELAAAAGTGRVSILVNTTVNGR